MKTMLLMMLLLALSSAHAADGSSERILSADLSSELWDGFGVNNQNSSLRFGHVEVGCNRKQTSSAFDCYGAYKEDNYMGYLSSKNVESIIPDLVSLSQDGLTARGLLRLICTKVEAADPICKSTDAAFPQPPRPVSLTDEDGVACKLKFDDKRSFILTQTIGELRSKLVRNDFYNESRAEFQKKYDTTTCFGESNPKCKKQYRSLEEYPSFFKFRITYVEQKGYYPQISVRTNAYSKEYDNEPLSQGGPYLPVGTAPTIESKLGEFAYHLNLLGNAQLYCELVKKLDPAHLSPRLTNF